MSNDEVVNEVVKAQIKQIEFLRNQVQKLQKGKAILEAALTRQTIEAGKSFRELQDEFDELARQIYDVIVYWVAKLRRPLTYDEIIRYYRMKYARAQYQSETITRRVRKLAEDDWLHSPTRGTFVPVPKEMEKMRCEACGKELGKEYDELSKKEPLGQVTCCHCGITYQPSHPTRNGE